MTKLTKLKPADRLTLIFGLLILILFLSSLTFYLFRTPKQLQRRFLFPSETGLSISGEIRPVPRSRDLETEIAAYVKELLLGPSELRMGDLFPEGTRLNQLKLLDKTLYVDFSKELVFNLENHPVSLVEIKGLVVDNLTMNYPRIESVVITVNGVEPEFEIKE